MASKPLDILKKGLRNSRFHSKLRKEHLEAELSRQESISSLDAVKARENNEINGGDDVDEGVDTEPLLTRREVLKAVSTINKYIDGLDDPVSRKIEGLLRSFNQQLHLNETKTMKNTVLTNYFQA